MSANTEQDLVYTVGPRGVITPLITAIVGIPLAVLLFFVIVGKGPIDGKGTFLIVGLVFAVLFLTAGMPYVLIARVRQRFTPDGIGTGRAAVSWADVRAICAIPTLFGYRVRLVADGRHTDLLAPAGLWWGKDSRFLREFAELRAYAAAHGARLDPASTTRRTLSSKVGLVAGVAVVAVVFASVQAGQRGWIAPWNAVAVSVPDACRALDAAGLDQLWPAAQRKGVDSDAFDLDGFGSSSCVWDPMFSTDPARWGRLAVSVDRERSSFLWSAQAEAADAVADHCRDGRVGTSIGDESCIPRFGGPGELIARKANVVVHVTLTAIDGNDDAGSVAATLASRILAQVRFG
jgi:hypothetical protein